MAPKSLKDAAAKAVKVFQSKYLMFPQNRRIPRSMFPLLSSESKTYKNSLFLLKFVPQNGESRFCFSISKKVAKNAVVRNRMRRAGYRLLEKYLPDIKIKILAVFYFRIIPKSNEEIIKNIELILKESKLIK
jgi:ribonuclease P protein component